MFDIKKDFKAIEKSAMMLSLEQYYNMKCQFDNVRTFIDGATEFMKMFGGVEFRDNNDFTIDMILPSGTVIKIEKLELMRKSR